MKENFETSLRYMLSEEGGWADDPDDPGGQTWKGITLKAYCSWCRDALISGDQLRQISDHEIARFYRENYWDPVQADLLPPGVDLMAFDAAVNCGVSRSAKILQECVGVTPDGSIGPVTIAKLYTYPIDELIEQVTDAYTAFYKSLGTFWKFGRGWLARVVRRHEAAMKLLEA